MPIVIKVKPKPIPKVVKDWKSRAGAMRYGSAIAAKNQHYQNPKYKEYQQPRAASIVEHDQSWSKKA